MRRAPAILATLLAVAVVALAACSSSSDDAATRAAREVGGPAPAAPSAGQDLSDGAVAEGSGEAGTDRLRGAGEAVVRQDLLIAGRDLIRTAWLALVVDDVREAASEIRWLAESHGGFVADQTLRRDPVDDGPVADGPAGDGDPSLTSQPRRQGGQVTVRVPAGKYQDLYDALSELGEVEEANVSTRDVSEAVIDLESRIESGRRSVDRLRALLGEAETISDLIQIESELSRREADLEALQSQLASLTDQVSLSTLTVSLRTDPEAPADGDDADDGFLGGLQRGWDAARTLAVAGLTVAGFTVPFLPVVALAVGIGIWAWRRHRRQVAAPVPPAAPSPA